MMQVVMSLKASLTYFQCTSVSRYRRAKASDILIMDSSCLTVTRQDEFSTDLSRSRSSRQQSRNLAAAYLVSLGFNFLAVDMNILILLASYLEIKAFSLFLCMLMINQLRLASAQSLVQSHTTKNRSKRDIMGAEILMLFFRDFDLSYRPKIGLAAAKMLVRAFKVAYTPAFAIEIVCCSIASWIAVWSLQFILSNQSMQQIPLSANINAPASIPTTPAQSFVTLAVRPAALVVFPLVQTLLGTNLLTAFRNCDLAVDGSPTIRILISPLMDILFLVVLWIPPNSCSNIAFLISLCPKMEGKSELAMSSYKFGFYLNSSIIFIYCSDSLENALLIIYASWYFYLCSYNSLPISSSPSPSSSYLN